MTFNYNVAAGRRKELVQIISEFTGCPAKYLGAPTFMYEVGPFAIAKDGAISFDVDSAADFDRLCKVLTEHGFIADKDAANTQAEDSASVNIQIPAEDFDEFQLLRLKTIVAGKSSLIKKAMDAENLTIEYKDGVLNFPWFSRTPTSDELKAYIDFITAVVNLAKTLSRAHLKEKAVENEKYAFRCFLLRLGLIGDEYKATRKLLLRNLDGSAAFKKPKEDTGCEE